MYQRQTLKSKCQSSERKHTANNNSTFNNPHRIGLPGPALMPWWRWKISKWLNKERSTFAVEYSWARPCRCGQSAGTSDREPSRALASFQLQSIVLAVEMRSDTSMEAKFRLHRCLLDDIRPGRDAGITRSVSRLGVLASLDTSSVSATWGPVRAPWL